MDTLAELQQQPFLSGTDIFDIPFQKKNMVRCYEDAIGLERKAKDERLTEEYERRKEKAIVAMQWMER